MKVLHPETLEPIKIADTRNLPEGLIGYLSDVTLSGLSTPGTSRSDAWLYDASRQRVGWARNDMDGEGWLLGGLATGELLVAIPEGHVACDADGRIFEPGTVLIEQYSPGEYEGDISSVSYTDMDGNAVQLGALDSTGAFVPCPDICLSTFTGAVAA